MLLPFQGNKYMGINYIYRKCQSCGGDGIQNPAISGGGEDEIECPACAGSGVQLWGELHDELIGEE